MRRRAGAAHVAILLATTLGSLTGCFGTQPRPFLPATAAPPPAPLSPPIGEPSPSAAGTELVPRAEPRSRYGNPPFYEVFGKRYYVLSSGAGYIERGVASWYGPGFHKIRTSTGEPYDMYGMTAAHKTLPLPAYVRVTNLQNGLSVVVRVNDRGPFVGNRIIDLSYTAASRLDMLRNGTAMVEVRELEPLPLSVAGAAAASPTELAGVSLAPVPLAATPLPATPLAASTALFIQAGAFSDPANAQRMADKLKGGGYDGVFVRADPIAGRTLYRVRIGPIDSVAEFDRVCTSLEHVGISDAHLAHD